ncbi:MAG: TIM-barrel domain-containing protein [Polyangiales bacterium]
MRRVLFLSFAIAACSSKGESSPTPSPDAETDACTCTFDCTPEEDKPAPTPHTPRWAFRPWISKDISDRADTYAFVKGFEDRDIPVGAVVLDSPWETNYNSLIPNPKRYGDFAGMVKDLHAKDIRVVLWITQMVNYQSFDFEMGGDSYPTESPNYEEGLACGFFVNKGTSYGWWKGVGGAIDFFNPKARRWWHAQQDVVLDAGIDGWKLDFGDSYVDPDVNTGNVETAQGGVPHQQYSERYYQDYLTYGVSKRGKDFLTDVRPWDESYQFKGRFFARREHAPIAWVGDNRRDWFGLKDALDEIMRSAKANYVAIGSDIGGYLDKDDKDLTIAIPADTLVFARWTGVAAFTPFFQLHGRANLAPWTVGDHADETVALYRYWAKLHDAMVPFFYSLAEEAWKNGNGIIAPASDTWTDDFRFLVGDAFLVAPIIDATGKRDVQLPAGRWYDWWTGEPTDGGKSVSVDVSSDRAKVPVFVHEGAIVPLDVVDDANALGTKAGKGARTIAIWPTIDSKFPLHDEDDAITTIEAKLGEMGDATITLSRATKPTILRVRLDATATKATVDGTPLAIVTTRDAFDAAASALFVEPAQHLAWVKVPASTKATTIAISP